MSIKVTTRDFVKRAKFLHGDKYNYDKVVYINSELPVLIHCNTCNQDFYQTPSNHTNKTHARGCPYCGKIKKCNSRRITTTEFIEKAKLVHNDDRYDYSKVKYINNYTKVEIYCKKCKKYFWQAPANHLQGMNCPCTANNQKGNTEDFIKEAKKLHGTKYDYSSVVYKSRTHKVTILCLNCNRTFLQTPSHHLRGSGCPYCNKSKGENRIQMWLNTHNILYEFQYRFENCKNKKPLPFDFYLPDYNTCIEFQGQQHYMATAFSNQITDSDLVSNLKYVRLNDKIKREYCKKNKIILLEIKYDENTEEKLENFFKNFKK